MSVFSEQVFFVHKGAKKGSSFTFSIILLIEVKLKPSSISNRYCSYISFILDNSK